MIVSQFTVFQTKYPNSRIEKIETKLFPGKEVVFVRGITHQESRDRSLPGITLGPREFQKLYDEHSINVRNLLFKSGAYLGLAVATEKPLAEYIDKNGLFSLTMSYQDEIRNLTIEPGIFEKAQIDIAALCQNGKLLTVSEHYTATRNKNIYSFKVFDATPDYMQLSDRPEIGRTIFFSGRAFYDESKSSSGDVLGSVMRDYERFDSDDRYLLVGDRSDNCRGVFRLV